MPICHAMSIQANANVVAFTASRRVKCVRDDSLEDAKESTTKLLEIKYACDEMIERHGR